MCREAGNKNNYKTADKFIENVVRKIHEDLHVSKKNVSFIPNLKKN